MECMYTWDSPNKDYVSLLPFQSKPKEYLNLFLVA